MQLSVYVHDDEQKGMGDMIYTGASLNELIFPLGGIGTGSIGLAGNGALVDWEIFNRPNKGSINPYSGFAVRAEYPDGRSITRVLQGDWQRKLSGEYSRENFKGYGFGPSETTFCGFPHFRKVSFCATFPIATVTFRDPDFPGKVVMTAFNPMIPLDADNSGIPAAFFDIAVHSPEDGVKYTVVLSVCNPFENTVNSQLSHDGFTAVSLCGAQTDPQQKEYGDLTVAVAAPDGICQEYWYRGPYGYRDSITRFWNQLCSNTLLPRHYDTPGKGDICTVGDTTVLAKGKKQNFRFVIAWNVPNCYNYWDPYRNERGEDVQWKNYYATQFADSVASCTYALKNWDTLLGKTAAFSRSLHKATLDKTVIDAASATLAVLKSPAILRLEDGTFYGWEGVHERAGCCEGTCTHVWSYAYALCFLFPDLERSMRDTELQYDTDENGCMQFRTMLPLGRPRGDFLPCVDGQMATIIKAYRDWKLTGDGQWVKDHWPDLKKVLEFAWNVHNSNEWDRNKDGVLEGRQHHTLDRELFGPSSWLQGMYLAALKAASKLAEFVGDTPAQQEYTALYEKGRRYTDTQLFNGEYYMQKVDLTDQNYCIHFNCPENWNEESGQLKFQIGEGCAIDQLLGQWHANLCGLGDIFDPQQRKTALKNMLRNNYKSSLREIANVWRVFAINDEAGTIICDYPEGKEKPDIPIAYSQECMTGFEYAFAGLLISEGFVDEGLTVIRAIRDRYDGKKRNPFNEIECGSNYARSMASFALLPIFSGFTYDIPNGQIGFAPILPGDFRCFWAAGNSWGDFLRTRQYCRVILKAGSLVLSSVLLDESTVKTVLVDGKEIPFRQTKDLITFAPITVKKEIRFLMQ